MISVNAIVSMFVTIFTHKIIYVTTKGDFQQNILMFIVLHDLKEILRIKYLRS
jgi:hypothetical protein